MVHNFYTFWSIQYNSSVQQVQAHSYIWYNSYCYRTRCRNCYYSCMYWFYHQVDIHFNMLCILYSNWMSSSTVPNSCLLMLVCIHSSICYINFLYLYYFCIIYNIWVCIMSLLIWNWVSIYCRCMFIGHMLNSSVASRCLAHCYVYSRSHILYRMNLITIFNSILIYIHYSMF